MRTKEKEMAIFLDKIFPQIQGRFEIAELYESGALVRMKIINEDQWIEVINNYKS